MVRSLPSGVRRWGQRIEEKTMSESDYLAKEEALRRRSEPALIATLSAVGSAVISGIHQRDNTLFRDAPGQFPSRIPARASG